MTPSTAPKIVECRHARECGACAYLGQEPLEQLKKKRWTVGHALRRHERLKEAKLLPTLPSPLVEGYRNRAKMAVSIRRDGGWRLGYFKASSREVVDAPDCRVLVPALLETTRRLRDFLERHRSFPRELRHVDLRCGSDPKRQHLVLVLRTEKLPELPVEALLEALPFVSGLSVNLNPSKGPQVIRGAIDHLDGEREVRVELAGLSLRVSAGSFFQVNLPLLDPIHRLMGDFLHGGRTLADLYAGVGTHAFALRHRFEKLVLVEGVRGAVADARATAEESGAVGVDFVASPVERSLRELEKARPDAVVMNPSRAGAHRKVVDWLVRSDARRLAYLSCDPGTLARDLAGLVEGGWRLASVQPIDMMPQTRAVEALALLRR